MQRREALASYPRIWGAIVSSHYFVFDLDKTKVDPQFFDYVVRYGPYREMIQPFVKGTTNYSAIRPHHVLSLKIPLPPIDMQQQFVTELSRHTDVQANAENMLETLEKAGIDKSFFHSENVADISDIAKINPSYPLTDKSSSLFVEMAAVDEINGTIKYFKNKTDLQSSGLSRFRENDILFARITPCTENGKIAIASGLERETGTGSTELVVFSPSPKVNSRWLYFFLNNHDLRQNAEKSMTGTTGRRRVPMDFFNKIKVPLHSLEEQDRQVRELESYIKVRKDLEEIMNLSDLAIRKAVLALF